jgi:hypothetical protein
MGNKKKKKSKNTVSGTKEEISKKLSKPRAMTTEKTPSTVSGRSRIRQTTLTHKDTEAFRARAYMGPLDVERVVGKTLAKEKEKVENTIFMERLRKKFEPKSVVFTNAPSQYGLIWRAFVIGTEHIARFATDRQFDTGIGVGNPTFKGSKKNNGIALSEFLKPEGIVPQRNKPESYRFFPATEENLKACTEYIVRLGGELIADQSAS